MHVRKSTLPCNLPIAPNAVIIGFIGPFLGGLVAMALSLAFHSPTIMIPCSRHLLLLVVLAAFVVIRLVLFLAPFLVGIFLTAGPRSILHLLSWELQGILPNVDYNIVGSIIYGIGSLFGLA